MLTIANITSCVVLAIITQVFSLRISPRAAHTVTPYQLTQEEISAFIDLKRSINSSYEPFSGVISPRPRSDTIYQSSKHPVGHYPGRKYESSGNADLDCVSHNGVGLRKFRYYYERNWAICERPGESPNFTLNCSMKYSPGTAYNTMYPGKATLFIHVCPHPKVCINTAREDQAASSNGASSENVACVERDSLTVTEHSAVAMRGAGSEADSEVDWCSLEELIPGLDYPPTWHGSSFVLTEEVSWANGSFYNAPKLYIRDDPNYIKNGYDHAFKRHTNVVTTALYVGSVRGRLQSRPINFCMELLRGGEMWTVMLYTWFRVSDRRGLPPTVD